ncbi:uncharacterized protein LOC131438652 [Malaya genurostris]|uniref:uncharacterized protein LOC131438652 n=1 Tax=Malaya genurostris TaxID=325434 RepID=UPI0026F3F76B|nr:uncharacterized protein LOC131438652 [Malaya genurostris]
MKIDSKLLLLLFGTLMVLGSVHGQGALSPDFKRRIIRSMLDSQKDIRKALQRIKFQIMKPDGPEGAVAPEGDEFDDDDEDDDDGDGAFDGDDNDISGIDDNEYFKEQQRKIRAARAKLEAYVKQIASNLIAMHEHIRRIDDKINEQIREAGSDVNYNLYYQPGNNHHTVPPRPPTFPTRPTRPTRPTYPTVRPTREPPATISSKRFNSNGSRGGRSLEEPAAIFDAKQLDPNPEVENLVTHDGPARQMVQANQEKVDQ